MCDIDTVINGSPKCDDTVTIMYEVYNIRMGSRDVLYDVDIISSRSAYVTLIL